MITQHTYRQILAVFLFAVYAFIATPVQLWHHHKYEVKASLAQIPTGAKSDSVSQGTVTLLETDCPVCSHKYAAYNDEVLTPFDIILSAKAAKDGYFLCQPLTASQASLPNKGPPALS